MKIHGALNFDYENKFLQNSKNEENFNLTVNVENRKQCCFSLALKSQCWFLSTHNELYSFYNNNAMDDVDTIVATYSSFRLQ